MSSERILRGGLDRLIVYRADTGAALDLGAVVIPARDGAGTLDEQHETTPTAAGTTRTERKERSIRAVISDQAAVEVLQAWQRAGARVRAVSIGMASAAHRLWNEPVRIDLRASDGAFGQFAGHLLTLTTSRFHADVALTDNLNGLDPWEDADADELADGWTLQGEAFTSFVGSAPSAWQHLSVGAGDTATLRRDVTLPAPGLRVRLSTILTGGAAGDVLVDDPGDDAAVTLALEAYRFGPIDDASTPIESASEAITAEGEANVWLTLPAETHTVRLKVTIEGGTAGLAPVHVRRPRLFTRPEPAENLLNGGFIDRGESADGLAWVIEEFGSAWVEEAVVQRTFTNPITGVSKSYDVTVLTLGPGPLLDILATDHPTEEHTLVLDTYTPIS